jgi:hypothetical protein
MTFKDEIESLIKSLNLPHKLIVSYALACAKSVNTKEFGPTAEALKCIELIEKWLADDKSVTNKELLEAANAAFAAADAAAYAAYYVAYYAASYVASYAAYAAVCAAHAAADAAYAAADAANAANAAADGVRLEKSKYKELLFETIKIKYGELGVSLIR